MGCAGVCGWAVVGLHLGQAGALEQGREGAGWEAPWPPCPGPGLGNSCALLIVCSSRLLHLATCSQNSWWWVHALPPMLTAAEPAEPALLRALCAGLLLLPPVQGARLAQHALRVPRLEDRRHRPQPGAPLKHCFCRMLVLITRIRHASLSARQDRRHRPQPSEALSKMEKGVLGIPAHAGVARR